MPQIARHFWAEIDAAGVSRDGWSIDPATGAVSGDIDAQHLAAIEAVVTAHDPDAMPESEKAAGVNAERARRIEAGCAVTVTGIGAVPVQGRDEDARNLAGLVTAAQLRIGAGDTTTTVPFRDADNTTHDLTPLQIVELWQGAASWVTTVYGASWALKDNPPIPADFADDSHWPAPQWPQP